MKKGLPGVWKIHGTLQVTLCCAHNTCCKHRDKPWFSWHPAAAEHGQNEQKQNKCMVKTEHQSMMQQRWMINTKQPEISNERQPVQLSVHTHITPTDKMWRITEVTFLERDEDAFFLSGYKNGSHKINYDHTHWSCIRRIIDRSNMDVSSRINIHSLTQLPHYTCLNIHSAKK